MAFHDLPLATALARMAGGAAEGLAAGSGCAAAAATGAALAEGACRTSGSRWADAAEAAERLATLRAELLTTAGHDEADAAPLAIAEAAAEVAELAALAALHGTRTVRGDALAGALLAEAAARAAANLVAIDAGARGSTATARAKWACERAEAAAERAWRAARALA